MNQEKQGKIENLETLYRALKVHDSDGKLSLSDNSICFKMDESYEIRILDNRFETYIEILKHGKQQTHWHLDFEDTYEEMASIMQRPGECIAEIEEAIRKSKRAERIALPVTILICGIILVIILLFR
ncbi:hypothetical protein LJC01_01410 [Clostridiaceae bacterium OttesenSCG-928-D20]|nr:hypothetical protein [Clostridiaceae bacterium OttesenSCG-928-D20]